MTTMGDHEFGDIVAGLIWFKDKCLFSTTTSVLVGLICIHLGSVVRRAWEVGHFYEISRSDVEVLKTLDDQIARRSMLTFKWVGYLYLMHATILAVYNGRIGFSVWILFLCAILLLTPRIFRIQKEWPESSIPGTQADRVTILQVQVFLFSIIFYFAGKGVDGTSVIWVFAIIILLILDRVFLVRRMEKEWKAKLEPAPPRRKQASSLSGRHPVGFVAD